MYIYRPKTRLGLAPIMPRRQDNTSVVFVFISPVPPSAHEPAHPGWRIQHAVWRWEPSCVCEWCCVTTAPITLVGQPTAKGRVLGPVAATFWLRHWLQSWFKRGHWELYPAGSWESMCQMTGVAIRVAPDWLTAGLLALCSCRSSQQGPGSC